MGLLDGLVGQVVSNALGGGQQKQQSGDLGGLLGQVVASQLGGNQNQSQGGLGGLLGSVVASQLGGGQSQNQGGLGGMLGGLLGGQQQKQQSNDLGGLLGQVVSSQLGGGNQGGFNKNALLVALIPVVLGFIQKNGGLSGVLAKFNGAGLDNKAKSWVALDQDNDGLDAGDVMRLFGNDEIDNVCQQTGASQNDVCQGIAELLPQVMNDLTPNGTLDDEDTANNEIGEILKQFGKAF